MLQIGVYDVKLRIAAALWLEEESGETMPRTMQLPLLMVKEEIAKDYATGALYISRETKPKTMQMPS